MPYEQFPVIIVLLSLGGIELEVTGSIPFRNGLAQSLRETPATAAFSATGSGREVDSGFISFHAAKLPSPIAGIK